MKAAVALLWETRERYPSAVPVLCVHDELVVECDEADGEGVARWLEECMVDGMKQFLKRVPVEVEAHVVRHWGEK
jgi:DNA polymerase-1